MVDTQHSLAASFAPVLNELDLNLYDVEVVSASQGPRILRVLVDRPGGVDLEAITAATQALSEILDSPGETPDPLIAGRYTLEVSSPGLERPLRRIEHWEGAREKTVTVKFRHEGVAQRVKGVVVSLNETSVTLDVDGREQEILFSEITGARTVFEWGSEPRLATKNRKSKSKKKSEKVA